MSALDDILKDAQRARLIPTVADSRKEERIVSVLLATLAVVKAYRVVPGYAGFGVAVPS